MHSTMSARQWLLALLTLALGMALALPVPSATAAPGDTLVASLIDSTAQDIGEVSFTEVRDGLLVEAHVTGIEPGFHGFHVHAGTACTNQLGLPDFSQAGPHLGHEPGAPQDTPHGGHAGDLPVLYADADGTARTRIHVDHLTLDDVEGRAVVVHAAPDNFANIPERYSSSAEGAPESGPDQETLAAGDSGGRVGCGVLGDGEPQAPAEEAEAERAVARLLGVAGGTVTVTALPDERVRVQARVEGLTPGLHGFHIHAGTSCVDEDGAPDFARAAGHLGHDPDAPADTPHGEHTGDLQILRAGADGVARTSFVTDAFTVEDITGRAVIVHAAPDNYANIPDRYSSNAEDAPASGPDAMTLATGDAGGRDACGIFEARQAAHRLSGSTRIQTAIAASQEGFPHRADTVVLARADRFPDALAGGPLADLRNGPVLLTYPGSLHPDTEAEITRLLDAGGTVTVLGGEAAISTAVTDRLRALGLAVDRIAGSTRIQTALAVADALDDPSSLLITTGYRFPDALAAGAAAAHVDGAVLLTVGEQRHPDVDAYIAAHPQADLFAVGGPAARPYDEAEAVSGPTREDTAIAVAQRFFDNPLVVGVARRGGVGDDDDPTFADALAGGAHAGRLGGPLLLTPSDTPHPGVVGYLCAAADRVDAAYAYGGTSALSASTVEAVGAATTGCEADE